LRVSENSNASCAYCGLAIGDDERLCRYCGNMNIHYSGRKRRIVENEQKQLARGKPQVESTKTPDESMIKSLTRPTLNIGSDDAPFHVLADIIAAGRTCVIGASGSGKSHTVAVLCEELCKKNVPFAIIDIEGEYWGLKEKYPAIWIGDDERCDNKWENVDLDALIDLAPEAPALILDLKDAPDQKGSAERFLSGMWEASHKDPRRRALPYLLIIDEADRVLPHSREKSKIAGEIAMRGRKWAIGLMICTQRPSLVDSDVLSQCNNQVIGKLTLQADLQSVSQFFRTFNTEQLTKLERGSFWVLGDISPNEALVRIRARETASKSETPKLPSDRFIRPSSEVLARITKRPSITVSAQEMFRDALRYSELDRKTLLRYGYDVLINNFETGLRKYVRDEIYRPAYGDGWRDRIPEHMKRKLVEQRQLDPKIVQTIAIDDFFEELYFPDLKELLLASDHFRRAHEIFGDIDKERFVKLMDALVVLRSKIAHAKSNFSELDLAEVIQDVTDLSRGEHPMTKEFLEYLRNEGYTRSREPPTEFFREFECTNNLHSEWSETEGTFVGRDRDLTELRNRMLSERTYIHTITGAGGVGKTAVALKLAYDLLLKPDNPFSAILWFTAKSERLRDDGIEQLRPDFASYPQLLEEILKVVDKGFNKKDFDELVRFSRLEHLKDKIYDVFRSTKSLLIIDNLETILRDAEIVTFIKGVPKPSIVLITSRMGLGEIEQRYSLLELPVKDAIRLFRLTAIKRQRQDLLRLSDDHVKQLVERVRCYPLAIKWDIGQVCLGKSVDEAFKEHLEGEIARFCFEDVFNLLSENARTILYSMIVWGQFNKEPVLRDALRQLCNLEQSEFEKAIRELLSSMLVSHDATGSQAEFWMLSLTWDFVKGKLDESRAKKDILTTRYYNWLDTTHLLQETIKSRWQEEGILRLDMTVMERIAYNYVKTAKKKMDRGDTEGAAEDFERAVGVAPGFSYVYGEYGKFECLRWRIAEAKKHFLKGTEVEPDNFFAWFEYGKFLSSKSNDPENAVRCLEKARDLNPSFLPTYNELGRALTLCGGPHNYQRADENYEAALRGEKYPNPRHKMITLQFKARNYRSWAEWFRDRKDAKNQLDMLERAYVTIKSALGEIEWHDSRFYKSYRNICVDYGQALCYHRGIDEGKPKLDESLRRIVLAGTRAFDPDPETIVTANFFLAHYSMRQGIQDIKQLESYVDSGLAGCAIWKNEERRATWERKYSYLKQKLDALEKGSSVGPSVKAVAENAPSGASVPRTNDPRILVEEGSEHILDIIGMSRGDGVGRIERLVVFVPGTKVGDRVKVRIKTMGPRFAIGELTK